MARLDFQQSKACEGAQIYYPFEGRGAYVFTPDDLEVAARPDGLPDLLLQLYRGQNPALPPQPYGILHLRLNLHYPLEAASAWLHERHPGARLEPAIFAGGYLRMYAQAGVDMPPEAGRPIPLAWNGLANARLLKRLSALEAQFLRDLLQEETLPWAAQVELELAGMAPRLPLRVRIDLARFREALVALMDSDNRIARNTLVHLFSGDPVQLGLEVEGTVSDAEELAETLADWTQARFGSFTAAPSADGLGYMALALNPVFGLEGGVAEWDLSQPLETWRPIVLSFSPFEAARQAVRTAGMDVIAPPPIIVPPLATGMFQVDISANIPAGRHGVMAVGVMLKAAPRPPLRPQTVTASAELLPPADTAAVRIKLSPAEPLTYTYSTFVIVDHSNGILQLDGNEVAGGGEHLLLAPNDFPVRFIPQAADKELLELAEVCGRCLWLEEGAPVSLPFSLGLDRHELALPLPLSATDAAVEYEFLPRDGGRPLRLGPFPLEPRRLGLHSFPEYGSHQVTVELADAWNAAAPLIAVDLLPEDRPETAAAITVLVLTPDQPRKVFVYFAASPFHSGYLFRRHAGPGGAPGPWSEVQSPFERLVLDWEEA